MSYLVLARKYRPQTFADLVGQQQVSQSLQNALASQRVAHAYLFAGPRGVGKTTAARLLAMALSCQTEDVSLRPCGACQNCLDIKNGQTVDVIEVDAASNRGINEIRDLRETVKYLPAKNKYKVYIIDEVHALTKDAFNALLKTLEEPPPHVVFIFATTETHKILPTILSRCQRYDFKRIKINDMVKRLSDILKAENIKYDIKALELIARQAEGALRDALSLLDQVIAFNDEFISQENVQNSLGLINQDLIEKTIENCLSGNTQTCLNYLEESYNLGYDFKDLGQKLLELIRGLSIYKASPGSKDLLNLTESEENFYKEEISKYSLETFNQHFNSWLEFQNKLNRSLHPRWLLEAQVINLSQKINLMPLSELSIQLNNFLTENFEDFLEIDSFTPQPIPKNTSLSAEEKKLPENTIKTNSQNSETAETEKKNNSELSNTEIVNKQNTINSWEDFLSYFETDIQDNGFLQKIISNSLAEEFSEKQLILNLPKNISKSEIVEDNIIEFLNKLFVKAAQKPKKIILNFAKEKDNNINENFKTEKIEASKKHPKIKELIDRLDGNFISYIINENNETSINENTDENTDENIEELDETTDVDN